MSRVAVASLMHESNSFNPVMTPLGDFTIHPRSTELWAQSNTEVAGFLEAAASLGVDVLPAFYALATPSGPVEQKAYETLVDCLLTNVASCGPVDGVYL